MLVYQLRLVNDRQRPAVILSTTAPADGAITVVMQAVVLGESLEPSRVTGTELENCRPVEHAPVLMGVFVDFASYCFLFFKCPIWP